MFKKLYEKMNIISGKMDGLYDAVDARCKIILDDMQLIRIAIQHMPTIESMERTIKSQQRTIEQLTNALNDKYKNGLFIVSNDGRIPMVIQDGKEIMCDRITRFSIDWRVGEIPFIEMEQDAVTFSDEENEL